MAPRAAHLRVVRGVADEVELAALVAGLAGVTADHDAVHDGTQARAADARRRWRDGAQRLTDPLTPGGDAWRWSAHR